MKIHYKKYGFLVVIVIKTDEEKPKGKTFYIPLSIIQKNKLCEILEAIISFIIGRQSCRHLTRPYGLHLENDWCKENWLKMNA